MKSPLSQPQLGVYYACLSTVSGEYNYQNPVLFDLPQDVDLPRLQQAVFEALCAHPYLFSHVVVDDEGRPEMETPNAQQLSPLATQPLSHLATQPLSHSATQPLSHSTQPTSSPCAR